MPHKLTKILSFLLCFVLIFQQSGFTQIAGELDLSGHFFALRNSFIQDRFRPLHLRYLSYDALSNNFNLLLDKGDFAKGLSPREAITKEDKGTVPEEILQRETKTLLNYFFIGISLPNEAFWVNLRPDSPNNIIDPELAETDVGRILLEADLQLKKDTANFTSPQTPEGKDYWDKLYKKAEELYGNENIAIPTLTRPWIVPDEIIIRESSNNAYIYKATLKVMLEQDYLKDSSTYSFPDQRSKVLNEYSSQLIRETIIPKLTKEINSSKRYAPLRQVYYSLILAQWFKQRFYGKSGVYAYLIDRHNLNGLTSKTSWSKTTYFNAYKASFQQGEYNIKEPRSTLYGQSIRSYMSGGIAFASVSSAISTGIVPSTRGHLGPAPYIIHLNTKGGSASSPFEVEIEAVVSAKERSSVAGSALEKKNITYELGDDKGSRAYYRFNLYDLGEGYKIEVRSQDYTTAGEMKFKLYDLPDGSRGIFGDNVYVKPVHRGQDIYGHMLKAAREAFFGNITEVSGFVNNLETLQSIYNAIPSRPWEEKSKVKELSGIKEKNYYLHTVPLTSIFKKAIMEAMNSGTGFEEVLPNTLLAKARSGGGFSENVRLALDGQIPGEIILKSNRPVQPAGLAFQNQSGAGSPIAKKSDSFLPGETPGQGESVDLKKRNFLIGLGAGLGIALLHGPAAAADAVFGAKNKKGESIVIERAEFRILETKVIPSKDGLRKVKAIIVEPVNGERFNANGFYNYDLDMVVVIRSQVQKIIDKYIYPVLAGNSNTIPVWDEWAGPNIASLRMAYAKIIQETFKDAKGRKDWNNIVLAALEENIIYHESEHAFNRHRQLDNDKIGEKIARVIIGLGGKPRAEGVRENARDVTNELDARLRSLSGNYPQIEILKMLNFVQSAVINNIDYFAMSIIFEELCQVSLFSGIGPEQVKKLADFFQGFSKKDAKQMEGELRGLVMKIQAKYGLPEHLVWRRDLLTASIVSPIIAGLGKFLDTAKEESMQQGAIEGLPVATAFKDIEKSVGSPVADTVKAAVVSPVQGFLGRPADGIVFPPDLSQEQIEEIKHSEGGKRVLREENGEIKIQDSPWIQINSRFEEINASFKDILGGELFDKISALSESRKEEPVYVLGWGAGDLTEIMDLHDRLKAKGRNNVFILAFGDTFYPASRPIPDNILFIVDTDTKLQERIKEFLGNGKVDIIYSYTSLWHLLPTHNEDSAKLKRFFSHLRELENLLTEDGFIVFDFVPEQHGWGGYIQQYSSQNGRALTVKTYNAETGVALLIRSKVAAGSPMRNPVKVARPGINEPLEYSTERLKLIQDRLQRQKEILAPFRPVQSLQQEFPGTLQADDITALITKNRGEAWAVDLSRRIAVARGDEWGKFRDDPVARGLVEGPAQMLVTKIREKGGLTSWSNAYGPYLYGVVWAQRDGVFYFTPLTEQDYISYENLALGGVSPLEARDQKEDNSVGGIDMRSLPKYTKVEKVTAGSPLVKQGQSPSGTAPLSDKEWQEIERMANSGIAPSCERIREYLLSLQDPSTQIDRVLACIADILRQEEEKACGTESSLKEILVLLESGKPVNELRLALINIQVLAKEPQLITQ
ncbi:MAG: hypothetical protein PHP10_00095 [Candidatus Omnitrophica bacterium]|nr:hypothetical protein [Candidatus Omnitrophota bacterium]